MKTFHNYKIYGGNEMMPKQNNKGNGGKNENIEERYGEVFSTEECKSSGSTNVD